MEIATADTKAMFGKWRSIFWPIHGYELSKFLPLFFMKFCASFNYTILNATKDTITVTLKGGGAEVIPVLKGGAVLVIAFLVMLAYTKLSNKLSREKLFYTILTPFLIFFLIFGLFLFPNREVLSPTITANWLQELIGSGHQHWVFVYRYWMNSLFFVFAELWGGVMIGLLFWGFANQISSVQEAARFYVLYTVGGHLGTMAGGSLIFGYSHMVHNNSQFESLVTVLMGVVVIVGIFIIAAYWWTNKYILFGSKSFVNRLPHKKFQETSRAERTKLSLRDSLLYIARSPYLGLIALLVIGYGVSVNFVEVTWKAILRIKYPDPVEYQEFMGLLQGLIGLASLFVGLCISGQMLRKFGWCLSAMITPIVLGVTSLIFFLLLFMVPDLRENAASMPLMLLVICGMFHNVACKAMKYCVFDPTKEMAYIPLDQEAKVKGKAAVDLVGARFGKSGASWMQLAFIDLLGGGSILGVVPLLVPCVAIVVIIWIVAVRKLNKRFNTLQSGGQSEANFGADDELAHASS